MKNEGIKTLKEYVEFAKNEPIVGGMMSMADELFLIEIIESEIKEHEEKVNNCELELIKKSNECDAMENAVDDLEAQLKAKDEHIKELKECYELQKDAYNMQKNAYEEIVKIKDKKIIKLKELLTKQKQRMTTIKQALNGMEDTQNQINILLKGM